MLDEVLRITSPRMLLVISIDIHRGLAVLFFPLGEHANAPGRLPIGAFSPVLASPAHPCCFVLSSSSFVTTILRLPPFLFAYYIFFSDFLKGNWNLGLDSSTSKC